MRTIRAPLIDPAVKPPYGNPGERKRLQCNTKPDSNTNRNPAIRAFESGPLQRGNQNHFPLLAIKNGP